MAANAAEWDAKHREASDGPTAEATEFVRELLPLLPMGPALDLACGTGRHSLLLAERRQAVTAVDFSDAALEILERRALEERIAVRRVERGSAAANRSPGIQLWCADLERVRLPERAFALIVCVNYLQRSIFSQIEGALIPGGVLLYETYTVAQLEFGGGPRNREYLLEPGELRCAFAGLRTLFYRELRAGKGIAGLIARKAD